MFLTEYLLICRPIHTSIQLEMQKVVELVHIELLVLVVIWCSFLSGGLQQSELLFLVELAFSRFPCSVVKLISISSLSNRFVSGF